ncbi:hypothetical protein [Chitinophaga sp. Cy-1792]|uniref:hypothetical protein n=1 Tax=Chitinophaga sp. Cy-1792 TaxID=2608339 RepID=UPI0014206F57|nr:hypothetical protein [Chitinophaga sp. Cy-1792]NIG54300.1 hypothetical protein [Chitinophaga sp. Cy-1792]
MYVLIYDQDHLFTQVLSAKLSPHFQVITTDATHQFHQVIQHYNISIVIYNVGGTHWLYGKQLVCQLKKKGINCICYADLLYEAYDVLYPRIGAEYCKKEMEHILNTTVLSGARQHVEPS